MERHEKRKKKKDDDWVCIYCGADFTSDQKKKSNIKWTSCDSCERKMHFQCVPKKYFENIDFDFSNDEDEIDFLCEFCTPN